MQQLAKLQPNLYTSHCPKNNLNLSIITELIRAGADAKAYMPTCMVHKPNKYHCICSYRDGLGFYAKIQIIFGTVCATLIVGPFFIWGSGISFKSFYTNDKINVLQQKSAGIHAHCTVISVDEWLPPLPLFLSRYIIYLWSIHN